MFRAIEIARLGRNNVKTNPNVGCVIVYEKRIIGEGYHEKYGENHAEVNALESVNKKDRDLITKSTMYVTLEPCNIHSKTPPCTDAILRSGIKNVFIGYTDPNPKVNGNGIDKLRKNGITVIEGLCKNECHQLIQPFNANLQGIPYVTLKWAKTSDNYMGSNNHQVWISDAPTSVHSHQLRAYNDGILVGKQTVKTDNPKLTTRHINGNNPTPIILDSHLTISPTTNIFQGGTNVLWINNISDQRSSNYQQIKVINTYNIMEVLRLLFNHGINRLLVEGGQKVLRSFIESGLWHNAFVITSMMQSNNFNNTVQFRIPYCLNITPGARYTMN